MEKIKVVESNKEEVFEADVNALLAKGYVVSSTACGFLNDAQYDFQNCFQAILINKG